MKSSTMATPDCPENYFDHLPNEMIEQIFASVPLMDLFRVCSLVCRRWRDIIVRPEFVPWKKAYFRYKRLPQEDSSPIVIPSEPPAKKRRLLDEDDDPDDDDDEPDEPVWKHIGLFDEFRSPDFLHQNDWINPDSSLLRHVKSGTPLTLETLLPSLVVFTAKKFEKSSNKFVQIHRHPKAR